MADATLSREDLLAAILPHVAFDGWSEAAFLDAVEDLGADPVAARAFCPRGAVDLAVAMHKAGDAAMVAAVEAGMGAEMRIRDRIAGAIRARLTAVTDKEAVRRASTLFTLPHMAPEGAALIWGTADAIWTAIGDSSQDANWYSKRATLSAVYGAVVLFWLGDDSEDGAATDAFIDRRIEDVMQVERFKAQVNANPLLKPVTAPFGALMGMIRAPKPRATEGGLPGRWQDPAD